MTCCNRPNVDDDDDWAAAMAEQVEAERDPLYNLVSKHAKQVAESLKDPEQRRNADRFLSQDEVDALLKGVTGETDPPEESPRVTFLERVEKLHEYLKGKERESEIELEVARARRQIYDEVAWELNDLIASIKKFS